jgi:hypothetical protein
MLAFKYELGIRIEPGHGEGEELHKWFTFLSHMHPITVFLQRGGSPVTKRSERPSNLGPTPRGALNNEGEFCGVGGVLVAPALGDAAP